MNKDIKRHLRRFFVGIAVFCVAFSMAMFLGLSAEHDTGLTGAQVVLLIISFLALGSVLVRVHRINRMYKVWRMESDEFHELAELDVRTPEQEARFEDLYAKRSIQFDVDVLEEMNTEQFNELFRKGRE